LSVATLYHYDGVFQDYKKALQWYKKVEGVDKGAAQNNIGLLYLNEHGIKQDRQKYLYYFSKSAELGCDVDCKNLEKMMGRVWV
jgi:TPR repeat protein